MRLQNPCREILRRVAQQAGHENPPAHQRERRADQSVGARNAGYHVARAAAFLGDEFGAVRGRSRRQRGSVFLRQRG